MTEAEALRRLVADVRQMLAVLRLSAEVPLGVATAGINLSESLAALDFARAKIEREQAEAKL